MTINAYLRLVVCISSRTLSSFLFCTKVIGDKAGAFTASAMLNDDAIDAVRLLEKTAAAKVKFIHVVRNPFDNIATMVLQHGKIKQREGSHEVKVR